jgi:hypothetical protein
MTLHDVLLVAGKSVICYQKRVSFHSEHECGKRLGLSLNLSSNVGSLLLQDSQLPKSEQKTQEKKNP